jgi:hypothetical protein
VNPFYNMPDMPEPATDGDKIALAVGQLALTVADGLKAVVEKLDKMEAILQQIHENTEPCGVAATVASFDSEGYLRVKDMQT